MTLQNKLDNIPIKIPIGESFATGRLIQTLFSSGSYVSSGDLIGNVETGKANQELYAPVSGILQWKIALTEEFSLRDSIAIIQPQNISQEFPMIQPPDTKKIPTDSLHRQSLSPIRKSIRQRLLHAQQTIPTATTINEVNLSAIVSLKMTYQEAFKKKYNCRLSFVPFFAKALASALQAYPIFNSYIENDELVSRSIPSMNIAISTDEGTTAPLLHGVEQMSIADIEKQIELLAKKAHESSLSADEIATGSVTLSNGGVFGSILSTPMLLPNQSAILAMHKATKRPIAVDDSVQIHPMMYLALTYDHGLVDGKEAIAFLQHICQIIEDPHRIILGI